jgi:hypothetical protein
MQVLALTFDDGPHVKHMTAVLDILKAEHIPATFFVNTEEQNSNPIILPFSSKPVQVCVDESLGSTPTTY